MVVVDSVYVLFGEVLCVVMLLFLMSGSVYYVVVDKVMVVIVCVCELCLVFVIDGDV